MGKKSTKSKSQKIFIEPLEQRIMLDGAGASTFLDLIDESSQSDNSNKSTHEIKKFKEIKSEDGSKDLPFTNVPRDQLKRKQIVFIDKQVPDYEKLAKSFRKNVEIHFIETNEDGFKKIEQTLENGKKYSAIHIIGHGSAGQILFGNALLTNESIENYKSTLSNIGESLTKKGDILFYGCNIAANDKGEALLKKISNLTKADIAASDDLTGKDGDWDLEKKYGIIETENVDVADYENNLYQTGISSINGNTVEKVNANDFTANGQKDSNKRFIVTLEKENITYSHKIIESSSTQIRFNTRPPVDKLYTTNESGGYQVSSSAPVNSYLFFLNDNTSKRKSAQAGSITFASGYEIVGVFAQGFKTVANTTYSKSGAEYQDWGDTEVSGSGRGRDVETGSNGSSYGGVLDSVSKKYKKGRAGDWWEVSSNNRTITFGATNGNPGDFLRIITKAPPIANNAPVARDVTKAVNENSISSQGDVVAISDDADGDALHISSIIYRDVNNQLKSQSMVANTNYSLNTYYGLLNINSSTGIFTYDASSTTSAYDAGTQGLSASTSSFTRINQLDAGDAVSDNFSYTLNDGTDTDTGTITVNITGINDTPIAVNDQNTITEGGIISRSSTTSDTKELVDNDTDVDGSDNRTNFKVLLAFKGSSERTGGSTPTTWAGNFLNQTTRPNATIRGNYGSLTIYYDGSYTYEADSQIAGLDSGEEVSDYFNYGMSDDSNGIQGGITSEGVPDNVNSYGVLQILISGVDDTGNTLPNVTNDTAYVYEDFTVTALDGASANDGYSSAPFTNHPVASIDFDIEADGDFNSDHGDHTGDLLENDSDDDVGDTLIITGVRKQVYIDPQSRRLAVNPFTNVDETASVDDSSGQSITGDYGTLSIGADGSFSYAATASATDVLDFGETVTDTFEYRVFDGTDSVNGTLTVTVKGINDLPVGVNDTDSVTAGSIISRSNDSEYDVLADDTDVDGDDIHTNFTLKYINIGITSSTFSDGSATINGTYGTLTINENGSYSYDTSSNANALALGNGVTASDIFTYGFYDNDGSTKLSETNNANNLAKSPEGTATLKITVTGQTPRTTNDTGYIAAGSTLTVADGASANDENGGGNYNDATGDHTGDVLGNDTGTSNTVTAIENSDSVTGTVGSALSGIYGDLTLNASGSYTYVANNAAMIGATTATDVFTYTVTDAGSGSTGTATITITVLGSNDAPTATDDTGYIYEDSTLEVTTDSEGAPEFGTDDDNNNESGDFSGNVMTNDEDPEGATISVTSIRHTGGTLAGSAISTNEDADTSTTRTDITASTTYANGSSVTGDYGTLTIGADGSYTYAANSANELDDGDIGTDIFTYTLSDGSLTNTATLTITVEGINDAPVAQDDYGFIAENSTLDVSNSANATTDTTTTNQTLKALGTAATTGDTSPQVLKFNNDGTKLFVWGYTTQKIYQYSLGTAYDISTINTSSSDTGGVTGVKVSGTFSAVGNGGEFNSDGTKLFISVGTGVINEHSLSTAYDITTINETASDTFDTGIGGLRGTSFNSDGTKLFINRYHASDTVDVVQFTLGSAYDLSSINYDGGFSSTFTQLRGLAFSSDGTKMFISNQSDGKIYQYSLATPHSINDGVTLDGAFDTSVSALRGLTFNDDGSKFYFVNNTNRQITSYDLGENYRVWNFANTGTTGESTGDLIDTSSSTQTDSDKDGSASLTISAIRTGTESAGTGTAGAVGSSLTGTYGTLTVQSTGAYTYAANLAATEALDKDDVAIDYFTYTLSDGTATDTAQLTIKVTGVNDAPTTTNDTGYIAKGSTLAVSNGGSAVSGTSTGSNSGDVLDNDTDLDITADSSGNVTESSDDSLTVTGTVSQNGGTNTSGSSVSSNSQAASVGSAVTGLYGSLTLNSNGSYSYVANNAQTLDEGETVTDIFTFTVTDTQSATTTATLTITVIGSNTAPVAVNDIDSVNEDATVTQTSGDSLLVADDTDADSDTLTVTQIAVTGGSNSSVTGGSSYNSSGTSITGTYGTLIVGADGTYTYVADQSAADDLDLNDPATDSFTYTISDGTTTDTATLIITVTGVNDTPVAQNDVGVIVEDGTLTVANSDNANVSGSYDATGEHSGDVIDTSSSSHTDSDADASASLTVSAIRTGSSEDSGTAGSIGSALTGTYGQLTIAANGSYSYVANQSAADNLDAGDIVYDSFNYTVSDGTATDTAVITITVIGVNDAPVANVDIGVVNEDATLTVSSASSGVVQNNDTDADTDDTVSSLEITTITYNGSDTAVTSGSTYNSGSPTVVTTTYGTLTIGADGTYTYVADQSATDNLDAGDQVTDVFTYTISDGNGGTDTTTLTITVTGVNDAPVAVDDTDSVNEDATVTQTSGNSLLMADDSDADDHDSFTVTQIAVTGGSNSSVTGGSSYNSSGTSITGTYGTLIVGADGTYTYVADQDAADALDAGDTAPDSFTYTISDGTTTDTATIIITVTGVNDLPTSANATVNVNERNTDASYGERTPSANFVKTFASSDFAFSDSDTSDSSLSAIKIVTLPSSGTLTLSGSSVSEDQEIATASISSLVYTPTANSESDDSFTFKVSDGTGFSTSAYTITVSNNAAPVVTDKNIETAVISGGGTSTGDVHDYVTDSDDADSDLVVTGVIAGNESTNSSIISNGTGVGSAIAGSYGTLNIAANGTYTYTSTVTLAAGASSVTDTFTYTTRDDETDTDVNYAYDTGTLTFTIVPSLTLVNDTDTVTVGNNVTVNDGDDEDLLEDDSTTTGNLTVSNISFTNSSDTTTTETVPSGNGGVTITGLYGQLTIYENGSYTYTPNQNASTALDASETGIDVFTYTATNGTDSGNATLSFTVTGVNDAPVAVDDTDSVNEDATVTQTSGDSLLMAHDTDADSDTLTVTQIAVTGESNSSVTGGSSYNSSGTSITGTYGTLIVGADGTYTYVADQSAADDLDLNDQVTDSFTYTISDGTTTDTATLIITVTGINDAPVAVDDTDSVNEDATVTQTSGNSLLMADDSDADDHDSFTVTQIAVTGGSNSSVTGGSSYNSSGTSITGTYGTLIVGADGTYTYVADQDAADALDAGDTAPDSFTYTISDGTTTDTATIIITVTGVNDAPTTENNTVRINENNVDGTHGARTTTNIYHDFVQRDFPYLDVDSDDTGMNRIKISSQTSAGDLVNKNNSNEVYDISSPIIFNTSNNSIGALRYVPDAGLEDDQSFSFNVRDSQTTYASPGKTMNIEINSAPVATDYTHGSAVATSGTATSNLILSSANGGVDKIDDADADDESDSSSHVLTITGVAKGAEGSSIPSGSVGSSVAGTYGSLVLNSNGSYTYTANATNNITIGSTASDVFNYTVEDDEGTTGSAGSNALDVGQLTFTVQALANAAPTASDGIIYVNENNQVSSAGDRTPSNISHTFQASDFSLSDINETAQEQSLSIKIATLPSSGTLTYDTTNLTSSHVNPGTSTTYTVSKANIGNLVYTPNADSEADDSFTFKAYDGVTDSTSTYTITVSVNAAPDVTDATVGIVAAGAASSGDVHDGVADSDDADSALVVTAAKAASEGGSYSTVINLGNNSNLVTAGTTSSNGLSVSGTYGTLVMGADGTYTYTASATNNIAYNATATDTFTFTTRDDETASGSFAYDVGELIFTVASSVSLDADTDTVNEDATVTVADGDAEDVLVDDTSATTVSHIGTASNSLTEISTSQAITGTYGTLTMYATGAYSYIADRSAADGLTVGVSANDVFYYKAAGATTTLTIAVTGIGPLAANDAANVNEDATAEGSASVTGTGVLGNDDGNASYDTESLRVTRVSTDNFSTATTVDDDDNADTIDGTYGTLTIYKTGQYSYTPNNATAQALAASASATDTFYYEIKDDGDVNASTATLVFTITGQNDAPVADNETGVVNEDATLTVTDGTSDVLHGDTDADNGASLVVTTYSHTSATNQSGGSASSGNSNSGTAGSGSVVGYYGTLTLAADGTYTYAADQNVTDALDAGDTVTDVFTYTLSDGTATDTATITITVTGVNDAPVANVDIGVVNEDATLTVSSASSGVVQNNDTDADTDDTVSSLEITTITYNGSDTAVTSGSTYNSGSPTVVTTTYGTLTIGADGTYTYVADQSATDNLDAGDQVTDVFTYTISDGNGGTDTTTLTITVTGVNDNIVAKNDTDSLDEGTSVIRDNTSSSSLDYNDTDLDNDNTYLTHQITAIRTGNSEGSGTAGTLGDPLKGTYGRLTVFADGSYIYNANNNILDGNGNRIISGDTVTDTFNYTVSDTDGATDTAVLTITINGTNEAPVAATDYSELDVGGSSISKTPSTGVTSNDADIEGSDLTVNGIRTGGEGDTGTTGTIGSPLTGTYGNITINGDGSYTYELDTANENLAKIPEGYNFYEIFTYTVTDDTGQTSTAEIVIQINGVNDAPTAVDDEATLDLETSSNLDNLTTSSNFVKANDNDVDLFDDIIIDSIRTGQSSESGTSITVGQSFASTYGNFFIQSNGGYAYNANDGLADTLKPGEKVYEYFTYTITDSAGLTATAQLSIEISSSANHANIELQEQGFKDLVTTASLVEKNTYDLPDRAPSDSSNFYEGQFTIGKFNDNLKLIDLRAQFKDKDGNYTTFTKGNPDDILVLQFSVFNDPGIELVRYKGEMKDGSALPDWVKINPKSGVVVADIPSGIDLLEFKVIGIDDKNNEFEIAVIIEASELRGDRELAKEFAGEIDGNISVDEDGNVEVQSDEEQTNNETENKSLNGNEVKIKSKKQINDFVKGEAFKPKPYIRDNKYIINLPDEIKNNLEKGIAVLRNGEKAPKWVKVNLNKGELILDPPKNLKNLNLTIVTLDKDGNKISNDVTSKINKRSAERFAKQVEIKEQSKFVSLNDQVGNENFQFDNYGEDILRRL